MENTLKINTNRALPLIYILSVVLLSLPVISGFGGLRFEQILFVLILPFTLKRDNTEGYMFIYISGSILLFGIYYLTHVYSVFYLAAGLALLTGLYLIKLHPTMLSVLVLLITVPAVKYLLSVFSFPLRLKLTQWAGNILHLISDDIEISGNCIYKCGIEFIVEEECLGLNMITAALAISVFILAFWSNKNNLKPPLYISLILLFLSIVFVALSNLVRIVLTVMLEAMPATFFHEFLGILVFIVHCCLPLFIIGMMLQRFYRQHKVVRNYKTKLNKIAYILPILIMGSLFIKTNYLLPANDSSNIQLEGFTKSISKDNVIKFETTDVLVYVKPPAFTLGSDHNPFICWKASGYNVNGESFIEINGQNVYTFQLTKDQIKLYSYWWYSNGNKNTSSQLDWRLAMLKGEAPFYLINVTSPNPEKGKEITLQLLNQNIIR